MLGHQHIALQPRLGVGPAQRQGFVDRPFGADPQFGEAFIEQINEFLLVLPFLV